MKKFKNLLIVFVLILVSLPIVACNKSKEKVLNVYDIDLVLNNDMTIDMQMEFTYYSDFKSQISNLKFNLYPNAFSSSAKIKPISLEYYPIAYENGLSYGEIIINKVKSNGENLDFNLTGTDNNILSVNLKSPLNYGESVKIFFDCKVVLPNVLHRFGYGNNTINLTGFYPVLCVMENEKFVENVYYPHGDPFYSECANYFVSIKVPSKYVVASSLNAEKTICFSEYTEYDYSQFKVRDIAFVLSDKFNILRKNYQNVVVSYYYFDDNEAENSLQTAYDSLKWYSSKFGSYPYKTYTVCQADFIYGGMEYPCLTFIDKTLSGIDKDYCISHETAHQWWYGLVGVNQIKDSFIDEGLTEYSTALFFNSHKKYGLTLKNLIQKTQSSYNEIRKIITSSNPSNLPIMTKSLNEYDSDLDYVSISYYRSQIMFDRLKNYMGYDRFIKALKELVRVYKYQNINTNLLIKTFEKYKKGSGKVIKNFISGKAVV